MVSVHNPLYGIGTLHLVSGLNCHVINFVEVGCVQTNLHMASVLNKALDDRKPFILVKFSNTKFGFIEPFV